MAMDLQRRLTPHFTLGELAASDTAARKGISNEPDEGVITALKLLCCKVLEPVRSHFARPVVITSGFRSPRLNVAVGGRADSQHCRGEAADFTVPGVPNIEVCRWIADNLQYDQLIYEFGESGWVHCSFSAMQMRRQQLSAVRRSGRTRYLPGIAR